MKKPLRRPLKLDVREAPSGAVVQVHGSASMVEAETLRVKLEKLAARRVPLIVLDLRDMDFISSAGLGAIISAHLKTCHHQGQIRLVDPQPAVRELLETTRLTKLFPIYPSVEAATAP